jgi:uncharacterized membrane protein
MSWLQRYQIRLYFRNSIWILPSLGMILALVAAPVLNRIETAFGWESSIHADSARAVLSTLASSMFTFIVFVSSALLVAVQLASAQLTPRIIAIVFRDPRTKWSLTIFVFAFTFTLAALVLIGDSVPLLTTRLAGYGCVASLGVFLYLIDHVGKALRPSGALRAVAVLGRDVIENVYPRMLSETKESSTERDAGVAGEPALTVTSLREGAVLAFDLEGLVSLAQRAGCVIELVPQVGDFLAIGDPLFHVYGMRPSIIAPALRASVAVGQERTMEQDPALAFRIMVDIANKGLSPAINDPTTAVLAVDQIHQLLRNVGRRYLDDGRVRDSFGQTRLIYRTPAWEDYVHLAVTEIRHFGGESIQIARRLRAMLDDLIRTLPSERTRLLRQELDLLRRSAERFFPEPEDRAQAEISDSQGVGSNCLRDEKRT